MKQTKILAGLGALLALSLLPACTNDLSDSYAKVDGLRLAKAPEITAWSGNHYFNSNTDYIATQAASTRADNQGQQDGPPHPWDFDSYIAEKHDHDALREFFKTIPARSEDLKNAKDITTLEQNYSGKEGEIFYIPEGTKGVVNINNVNLNNGNDLYNFGEISGITGIGWNGDLAIYNIGTFENCGNFTGSRKTVYNVGNMTVTNYSNIGNLYNEGVLSLERNHDEYNENIGGKAAIQSDMSIISLTGIKMPDGALYEGNADIHGIIESEKSVEFQTSKERYVCGLIVKGDLKVTAGTFRTGYVIADNLEFEGEHIWLLPDAYIKVDNTLFIEKANCEVYSANNSKAFIKTKDVVFRNKNNFVDTFSEGIYFSVTGDLSIGMSIGGDNIIPYNDILEYLTSEEGQSAIPRFNCQLNGQSDCGEPWKTSEEDMISDLPVQTPTPDPCPKADPETGEGGCGHNVEHNTDRTCPDCEKDDHHSVCNPCPLEDVEGKEGCGHPGNHHDDEGFCTDCENGESCFDPCPNIEVGVQDSGCRHKHSSHNLDGTCNECIEKGLTSDCNPGDSGDSGNTGTTPGGTTPGGDTGNTPGGNNPSTPSGVTKSEVEVNLSINDEHEKYTSGGISDLVAKLSIHVRYPGDVEVFIPIPKAYYVDNDDLVILNTHDPGEFVHGGPLSVTYKVGGVDVTLSLNYGEYGITVSTSGIDETVFNYCKANYGDGINFEVWLYTNSQSGLNFTNFQGYLNQSTIKFLDGTPDYYINAFKDTEDNPRGRKDCNVNIIGEQRNQYGDDDPKTGPHLNGSDINKIYKSTDCEGPDGQHDHDFLWK